jgi:hypothetical protein
MYYTSYLLIINSSLLRICYVRVRLGLRRLDQWVRVGRKELVNEVTFGGARGGEGWRGVARGGGGWREAARCVGMRGPGGWREAKEGGERVKGHEGGSEGLMRVVRESG